MNATAPPPKPAIILATPIDVEESRAQRLQRQQARFRDRGGIFVPTNRSTLLDILLGKASPLKKPYRSASASPSRADEKKPSATNEISSKPALRRSPRKQSQKTTVDVVTDEQPQAMRDDPGSEVSKPIKKATSSKSSRSRPQKRTKAPPKSMTKSRGAPPESLQASTQKIIPNADDSEDDVPIVKSKSKGKRVSETKHHGEVDGAKGTLRARGCKPATPITSSAVTGSTRRRRTKKAEPAYSELSEGDAACKPAKKASTKKVKKSAAPLEKATSRTSSAQKGQGSSNIKQAVSIQLADISEEDEEYNSEKDGPPCQSIRIGSLKDKRSVAKPASFKSLDVSDDDSIPLIKSKSKSSSQGKPQGEIDGVKRRLKPTKQMESVYSELSEDVFVYKPTKKLSTKKLLNDDAACKPIKKSIAKKVNASTAPTETEKCMSSSIQKGKGASGVNKTVPCQLPDIPEEDGEGNLGKEDTTHSESPLNAVVASSKGKKRASTSITQGSDSQPPRKRIKSGTIQPDVDPPLHHNSNPGDEVPPLLTHKKRRRNPEDVESRVEDDVDKSVKRKKRSGQSERTRATELPVEEVSVKPVAKISSMATATQQARKSKKRSSDSATTALKRKENASRSNNFEKKVKVASKSGPPKSVLQRIKDSLGAQVVDNEPDPIDFLS